MCDLYALWTIEKDVAVYLAGGYYTSAQASMIKELVLTLSKQFKREAVAVVDALAPPDEIVWSPLGKSW